MDFARPSTLSHHMQTHTGEKRFKCEICHKSFSQKITLSRHIRTHTGEKPFQCRICPKAFSQPGNLSHHMRTHTGEKPFKCEICHQSFAQKIVLKNHMKTHTHEKPNFSTNEGLFSAHIIEADTKEDNLLMKDIEMDEEIEEIEMHKDEFKEVQVYSEEKPSNLSRHIQTHTGEKRFKCEICQKSFSQKIILSRHMRTHTGEKPFKSEFEKTIAFHRKSRKF